MGLCGIIFGWPPPGGQSPLTISHKVSAMSDQPLVVHIPHTLGKEEAVRRMKRGLARASTSVPLGIELRGVVRGTPYFQHQGF